MFSPMKCLGLFSLFSQPSIRFKIARAAAAVGVTRGTMKDLVALDFENIPVRDQWKFGEDEGWRPPQKPRQAEAMAKSGLDTAAYTWEGDC